MEQTLAILEFFLFFLFFGISFKALMAVDIGQFFLKNAIWQMQIVTIFTALIMGYLMSRLLMHLIELMLVII